MPLHYAGWKQGLKAAGAHFEFTYELMCAWGGKSLRETVADLNALHGTDLDIPTVRETYTAYIREHLSTVQPRQAIATLARELATEAALSVASGGHREHVHGILQAIGLQDLFNVVVTQEDVSRAKPAPDLFLLAAARMGIAATDCLVYEDSPVGVEAAKAAGMDYILVEPH